MKYKVGDKVRITRNINGHGFGIGDIVKITEVIVLSEGDYRKDWYKSNEDGYYKAMGASNVCDWDFTDLECEPIKQNNPHDSYDIHITSNGVYTNCVYKKNGEIVSKSSAKLNETDGDVFSIKDGAKLCIKRLEDDKKKYNGKIICVENSDSPFFTIGKIYNVVEGEFRGDCTTVWDNDELFFYDLDSINRYFRTNNDCIKFIELVED